MTNIDPCSLLFACKDQWVACIWHLHVQPQHTFEALDVLPTHQCGDRAGTDTVAHKQIHPLQLLLSSSSTCKEGYARMLSRTGACQWHEPYIHYIAYMRHRPHALMMGPDHSATSILSDTAQTLFRFWKKK